MPTRPAAESQSAKSSEHSDNQGTQDIESLDSRNIPLYWKLADLIRANIAAGKHGRGDLLPSERELSETFGVSRVTVRKALNLLREEHVIESVGRLGHRVVGGAAQTAAIEPSTLFMCMPFYPQHHFGNHLLEAIERELLKVNFNLILKNTEESVERETQFLRELATQSVDGVFFMPSSSTLHDYDEESLRLMTSLGVIFIDRYIPGLRCNFVGTDNYLSSWELVNLLIEQGHRRIGYVGYKTLSSVDERVAGYYQALRTNGIPIDPALVLFDHEHDAVNREYGVVGKAQTRQLLADHAPPSAIVASNDFVATGVAAAIGEAGLRMHEDICVVGFDNDQFAAGRLSGPIATVEQDYAAIAKEAVKRLTDPDDQSRGRSRRSLFPGSIVAADSVSSPSSNRVSSGAVNVPR